jgi:hypothetical protein
MSREEDPDRGPSLRPCLYAEGILGTVSEVGDTGWREGERGLPMAMEDRAVRKEFWVPV